MVCRIQLPIFALWLTFPNVQAAYTLKGWLYVLLGKGYKSALIVSMGKILQPGYKTLFENNALFSLPLNGIFLFLQLEVITLDLDPENSFVKKKDKFFFNRNNIVAFNKKNYQRTGRVALGAVFIKKTRSNPNFLPRPIQTVIQTFKAYHVIQRQLL